MLSKKALFLFVGFLSVSVVNAQAALSETEAVEKTILNYIENFFENEFEAMNTSLHPRLAKRGLNPDGTLSEDFPPQKLKELMQTKKALPLSYQKNMVENVEVFGKMAKASLITGYPNMRWTEYVHLIKEGDSWRIINVFWEFYPPKDTKE